MLRTRHLPWKQKADTPEEDANQDWNKFLDLWHGQVTKDQMANKTWTSKGDTTKRESPEEEQLYNEKRCKMETEMPQPPPQAQIDMPGIDIKYRAEQPCQLRRTHRATNAKLNEVHVKIAVNER